MFAFNPILISFDAPVPVRPTSTSFPRARSMARSSLRTHSMNRCARDTRNERWRRQCLGSQFQSQSHHPVHLSSLHAIKHTSDNS
jgi:hypothetical protein